MKQVGKMSQSGLFVIIQVKKGGRFVKASDECSNISKQMEKRNVVLTECYNLCAIILRILTKALVLSPFRQEKLKGQMGTFCEDDICLLEPRHFLARNIVSCYEFLKYDLSCQLYCGHQLRYGLAYLHQPALVMPAGDLKIIHLEMKRSMRIPAERYNQR
jgi:hypothetical protein